jgi:hypothetical protein
MLAPRDPQTGQKQYLRGAVIGGMGAAGANAISNGGIANKLRGSVMNRESPLLGQGTRKYLMDSAAAGSGKIPNSAGKGYVRAPATAAAATSPQAAPVAATAASGNYQGGPVAGMPKIAQESFIKMSPAEQILAVVLHKKANQQTLTYDPATKTFTRQHLTPSSGGAAVAGTGASPILAGHTEAVRASPQYGSREYFQSRLQKAVGPQARKAVGTPNNAMRSLGGFASKMR